MITEDYCTYEVAKLLKEKGFDWPCHGSYHIEYPKNKIVWSPKPVNDDGQIFMNAPTHQMAMKWLREQYNTHISVNPIVDYVEDVDRRKYMENVYWAFDFMNSESGEFIEIPNNDYQFGTYEEAVEAALKYCLTTIQIYERDKNSKIT